MSSADWEVAIFVLSTAFFRREMIAFCAGDSIENKKSFVKKSRQTPAKRMFKQSTGNGLSEEFSVFHSGPLSPSQRIRPSGL